MGFIYKPTWMKSPRGAMNKITTDTKPGFLHSNYKQTLSTNKNHMMWLKAPETASKWTFGMRSLGFNLCLPAALNAKHEKINFSLPEVLCFISPHHYKPIINRTNTVQLLNSSWSHCECRWWRTQPGLGNQRRNSGTSGLYPGQRTTERWWNERETHAFWMCM